MFLKLTCKIIVYSRTKESLCALEKGGLVHSSEKPKGKRYAKARRLRTSVSKKQTHPPSLNSSASSVAVRAPSKGTAQRTQQGWARVQAAFLRRRASAESRQVLPRWSRSILQRPLSMTIHLHRSTTQHDPSVRRQQQQLLRASGARSAPFAGRGRPGCLG